MIGIGYILTLSGNSLPFVGLVFFEVLENNKNEKSSKFIWSITNLLLFLFFQ